MIAVREFKTVEEMLAFQKALKARLYPKPAPRRLELVPPAPAPVVEAPKPVIHVPSLEQVGENHNAHVAHWAEATGRVRTTRANAILNEVAYKYGITVPEMMRYERWALLVLARSEACWRLRTELRWSLGRIGSLLKRDHTTVMHNIDRYEARIQKPDPDIIHFSRRSKMHSLPIHCIAEINRLYSAGMTDVQIAAELDVAPANVRWAIGTRHGADTIFWGAC